MPAREAPETGIIIMLRGSRVILLASDVTRKQAAEVMWRMRHLQWPLKYFPVGAADAASTVRQMNQYGVSRRTVELQSAR